MQGLHLSLTCRCRDVISLPSNICRDSDRGVGQGNGEDTQDAEDLYDEHGEMREGFSFHSFPEWPGHPLGTWPEEAASY